MSDVLADGVRRQASLSGLVMDLQRRIEREAGARFSIPQNEIEDWVTSLDEAARGLIRGTLSREAWHKHREAVREHVDRLQTTGTRHAAEQVLTRVREAVLAGSEELLDEAVRWWVYDRQLYHLYRIARTEMSTAAHRAVIATTEDDEDVIGYHWRLSASHPEPDICDYYAGVEMGLGKGVWPKDQVPRHKAHPHCMCTLVPRVRPVKQRGDVDYPSWVAGLSDEKRRQILPQWAQRLTDLGMPLQRMVRDDGLGLVSKKALFDQLGDDRRHVLETIGKALAERRWTRTQKMRPFNRQTQDLVARLTEDWEVARNPEVEPLLRKIRAGQRTGRRIEVSSRELHYIKRRYAEHQPLRGRFDLDVMIETGLRDPDLRIYGPVEPGRRLKMYSPAYDQIIIVGPDGTRVSVYQTDLNATEHDPDYLGELAWILRDLVR